MEKQDVKAELIKYYQTKYQSAPNAYPGSGGIESMFKELDSEGVDIEIIRKVIITAIDRKFDSFMPISGGFKEVLSIGDFGNKAILFAQNRRRKLKYICEMATNKAIIRKK